LFETGSACLVGLSSAFQLCSGRTAIRHSEFIAISRSETQAILDRHPLGIGNRDHLGTMIFFSSE